MSLAHAIRRFGAALRRRESLDAELDDELRFHLDMETKARIAAGASPDEAQRQARALFGSPEASKDGMRDARPARWLDETLRDARLALRSMRRTPAFACLVVFTLAIGIGASTAVWALIDGIVLRPLTYASADRLFTIDEGTPDGGQRPTSYPSFLEWRERAPALDRLAYLRGDDVILPGPDGPARVLAAFVTPDFFPALGVPALLGRTFEAGDGDRPVVVSWQLWQSHFAGDASVVGRTLSTLDGDLVVVGVMPRTFREPVWADLWLPFDALPPRSAFVRSQRQLHVDSRVVGRLAAGATVEQASVQLGAVMASIAERFPDDSREWTRVVPTSLRDGVLGDATQRLRVLGAIVALVLLVTCLNVAGLLVARHAARGRELALRAALGARRGRLLRQLVVEGATFALAGAVLGVGVAAAALAVLRRAAPGAFPRIDEVQLDGRALLFTLVVVLVATLLMSVVPARAATAASAGGAFRHGSVGGTRARLRGALVVLQVALALCVAVGAGLLARTMMRLSDVQLGVDPAGVVALRVFPPSPRYDDPQAALSLYERLRAALATVPGAETVALANHLPFTGAMVQTRIVTGRARSGEEDDFAVYRTVSPEYLRAVGGTMRRGRFIGDADLVSVGSGVVVNEAFARRFFAGEEAVGRSITIFRAAQTRTDLGTPITASIVGILGDERIFGPAVDAPPIVYVPYTWNAWPNIYLTVRTSLPPARIVASLQRAVTAVDPAIPVTGTGPQVRFRPLDEYLDGALQSRRLTAWSLSVFSAVTLLLVTVGIFGVMAYLVVQSTREIGLRLALGSTPGAVRLWVLRYALQLTGTGIVLGVVAAVAGTRLLRAELAGGAEGDPVVYAWAIALFVAATLAASVIPAWRAARVDPMTMLRAD